MNPQWPLSPSCPCFFIDDSKTRRLGQSTDEPGPSHHRTPLKYGTAELLLSAEGDTSLSTPGVNSVA